MNEARQQQLLAGNTSLAKKVFEFVPIQEPWTVAAINSAIRNVGGTTTSHYAIRGCLGDMKDQGLIRETSTGHFQRVSVTLKLKLHKEVPVLKEVVVSKKTDLPCVPAIDLLAGLSVEVVNFANEFSTRLKKLAERIDEVAMDVEAEREQNAEALGKLKTLKSLLQSIP